MFDRAINTSRFSFSQKLVNMDPSPFPQFHLQEIMLEIKVLHISRRMHVILNT